jgi:hypothetical protein
MHQRARRSIGNVKGAAYRRRIHCDISLSLSLLCANTTYARLASHNRLFLAAVPPRYTVFPHLFSIGDKYCRSMQLEMLNPTGAVFTYSFNIHIYTFKSGLFIARFVFDITRLFHAKLIILNNVKHWCFSINKRGKIYCGGKRLARGKVTSGFAS